MAFWYGFALVALIAVALLLFSRVRIRVRYSKSGKLDQLIVIVRAMYGLVRLRVEVPKIMIRNWNLVIQQQTESQIAGKPLTGDLQLPVGIHDMKKKWRAMRGVLASTRDFKPWLRQTLKRVECTRFRLDLRVGTGDAPSTAFASGMLWTLYGFIVRMAGSTLSLKTKPHGAVEPVYSMTEFSVVWEADFRIRTGTALWAMLRLGARTVRFGQAYRSWRRWMAKPEGV